MKRDPDLAADLLERSIAQHEQRLANAQATSNTRLASRVQRDLERLLEQKQKMTGCRSKNHPVARNRSDARKGLDRS